MNKVVLSTVLIVWTSIAFADGRGTAVAHINLMVDSYICVGNASGTVEFSTLSGADANVLAGTETFTVKSNASSGYAIANASALSITGPSGPSYPTVTACASTSGGNGPTTGDTLTVTFRESSSWATTAASGLSYAATVTLTNRS